MPLVAFVPRKRGRLETDYNFYSQELVVCCMISDSTVDTATAKFVKYRGIETIDTFSSMVEAIITKYFLNNGIPALQVLNDRLDDEFQFPLFTAYFSYMVQIRSVLT